MAIPAHAFKPVFEKEIYIRSDATAVWLALTRPERMAQWMSEAAIRIITTWEPGSSITISGDMHGTLFENKGIVMAFEEARLLQYSHLSSLSELEDEPGNYCLLQFRLMPEEEGTKLMLTLSNFPTEAIYRHMVFYWNVATGLLKRFAEQDQEV